MRIANRGWRRVGWAVKLATLMVGLYFYALLRVRAELFYQQSPTLFLLDWDHVVAALVQTGWAVELAWTTLSPLFLIDWLGALIIALLAVLIVMATRWIVANVAAESGLVLNLVPLLPLCLLLGQYQHPVRIGVGLCVVLGLTGLYVRFKHWHRLARGLLFLILAAVTFWTAGELVGLLVLMAVVVEWRVPCHGGWRRVGAAFLAILAIVVGAWLCLRSIADAYAGLFFPQQRHWLATPSSPALAWAIRAGLLLSFPLVAVAARWCGRRPGSMFLSSEAAFTLRRSDDAASIATRFVPSRREAILLVLLIAVIAAADLLLFDVAKKYALLVAWSAEREKWADVLKFANRARLADDWTMFHVHRALYHRGELLERMFEYPQAAGAVRALTLQADSLMTTAQRAPLEFGDILFELGRVNESQHMAYEALEIFGERPRTLQRLVYLHAIKGELEAARRFLAVLERSLFYGDWARDFLHRMDADPTLSAVPLVASRRALMVERDYTGSLDTETMLLHLLERNPRNQMAFEYLMAYYLLTRQIDTIAANLKGFDAFGRSHLPRHCEEAILIHGSGRGSLGVKLAGREIRLETRRRAEQFAQALSRVGAGSVEAAAALYPEFGDSYFFFYVFGRSGPRYSPRK